MTHTTPAATASPASQAGALAGWAVTCETCGFVMTSTIRLNAEEDGRQHVAYMEGSRINPRTKLREWAR